jgi:hypothetical protein
MKKVDMKFALISTVIVASLLLGAPGALVLFLLAGVIPGTHVTVPPSFMLLLMITLLWLSMFTVANQLGRLRTKPTARSAAATTTPKRRYTEL